MTQNNELLEEIIRQFAWNENLSVMITDTNGELILSVMGENPLTSILLDEKKEELFTRIKDMSAGVRRVVNPLFLELWPGVHMVVKPVEATRSLSYYIWAGFLIEDGSEREKKEQLEEQLSVRLPSEDIIENTPVLDEQRKSNIKEWIQKLENMAARILGDEKGNEAIRLQNRLLLESYQDIEVGLDHMLDKLRKASHTFDFLGIAEKLEEDTYQVTKVSGEETEALSGTRFSLGEGFLGRGLLTRRKEFWESIENDPRAVMFHKRRLFPTSLFCIPIQLTGGAEGLLFGGKFTQTGISEDERELAGTMAAILEKRVHFDTLQQENRSQLHRLSSLVEISKLMATIPDYKRILYLLVDISLGLVEGSFASIVLKEAKTEKIQLVSRGSGKEQISEYARDVTRRYYLEDVQSTRETHIRKSDGQLPWDFPVIECPLTYNGELLGVLCVGMDGLTDQEVEGHAEFLETLSTIGGVSLQLAKQETVHAEEEKIYSLHEAIAQFDRSAYEITEEASRIAGDFAAVQGKPVTEVKELIQACHLSFYEADFIKQHVESARLVKIVREGKSLLENMNLAEWAVAEEEPKQFALACSYAKGDQLNNLRIHLGADQLVRTFLAFVEESQVVEEEITLTEDIINNEELLDMKQTVKELNLSPREQEVLDLVVQGYNNREIAEELFISGHTVKNHVTKIFQKLGVPDRAHAISKVYQMKYKTG
ncbi:LuxR C-terminal-related transcriptional regulator [Virgibacillus xinjiangensis]|uniref:LuxR C-terminal-related transcriptional regulator n=1 Tax=Virgibacillus xinjiangensis TaxID=393090 RepID=A0ABV7CTA5_9BACI